jgi:hypothetical protein
MPGADGVVCENETPDIIRKDRILDNRFMAFFLENNNTILSLITKISSLYCRNLLTGE